MVAGKKKYITVIWVLGLAVGITLAVGLGGCKKQSNSEGGSQTPSQPQQPKETAPKAEQPGGTAEKSDTIASSTKPSLEEIIKAAKRWGPVYKDWYGKAAPDFTLKDLHGKEHTLSTYRGKKVMLIFWATWCPPCNMEIPHLIELRQSADAKDVVILAVSDEKADHVKSFVERKKINYTVLLEDRPMPEPFGVKRIYQTTGIPGGFFIDAKGNIRLATAGLLSLDEIKAILDAI